MSEENNTNREEKYDSSQIQKLEGLEGVRKRPDMYIGDTNERGLHHCVFEIVDNSIDESLAGYCSEIKVHLHADGSCSIQDNGRGIPVDVHPKHNMPALELVLTNLHAGGKFGKGAYQVSGGLHGVGAKCVNAVSEWFVAEVRRDEKIHQMEFSRGKTTKKMNVIGSCQTTGTKVTFLPDEQIFTETREFKFDVLAKRKKYNVKPGKYQINGDFEKATDKPQFHMGIKTHSFTGKNLDMPGPGEYETDVIPIHHSNVAHFIGTSVRSDLGVGKAYMYPGPGEYEA